jgi:hypothetical protein
LTPQNWYFSIVEFIDPSFLDEEKCRKWVLETLHPPEEGPACPHCGTRINETLYQRFYENKRMHCRGCSREFVATTGTKLHRGRLDYREIIFLGIMVEAGKTYEAIALKIGMTVKSVREIAKRFHFGRGV